MNLCKRMHAAQLLQLLVVVIGVLLCCTSLRGVSAQNTSSSSSSSGSGSVDTTTAAPPPVSSGSGSGGSGSTTSEPTTAAPLETTAAPGTDLFNFTIRGTIYTQGDMIMRNPVEGSTIFVTAVLVASIVEWLIDYLRAIDSDSFQLLFESVREETLLVGIMTMILIFVISFGALRAKWEIMLNYAVMSLLLMVIFFVVIVALVVVVLRIQLNRWRDFEAARMDADPLLSSREQIFKDCRDRFHQSVVAKDARFSRDVLFSDYLKRVQRFTVARVVDLSWKSWAALALLIVINGVRSRFTTGFTGTSATLTASQRLANVASYIGFVGYGTLITYFIFHFRLARQLQLFSAEDVVTKSKYGEGLDIKRPSERLFFGSMETTSHIVQSTLLFMEWYMAVFALGMVFESWREFGFSAIGLYVAAIIPPIVYVVMLPWTLTIIAILSSLGEDLNIEEADACFDEIVTVKTEGGQVGPRKHTVRTDEYNGFENVTLHATANNPMLDEQAPALVHDARHLNAVPHEQRGFVLNKSRNPFSPVRDGAAPTSPSDSPRVLSRENTMRGLSMERRGSSSFNLPPSRNDSFVL